MVTARLDVTSCMLSSSYSATPNHPASSPSFETFHFIYTVSCCKFFRVHTQERIFTGRTACRSVSI